MVIDTTALVVIALNEPVAAFLEQTIAADSAPDGADHACFW